MSIYETSVKKPVSTILIFVAVIILGLFSLSQLAIDLMPDIETNQITIMTTYPGASALDIETNVTKILEDGLNTADDLKKITSTSKDNLSLITLEFEWGTDIDVATNDVRDKLDLVKSNLPDGIQSPIIFKFSTNMIPVAILSATAKESLPALYKILDERLANPLNRISGVGSVAISGAPEREVHINVDPAKLEAYKISIEQIGQIITQENRNTPGGMMDVGSDTYSLRIEGEFVESDQIKNLIVGQYQGRPVYMRDIAKIDDTLKERAQQTYTNGVQGAQIVILKQSGANSVDIAEKVFAALPEIKKNLPPDIVISEITNTSDFIVDSINSLTETVLLAGLFVMLVVLFFLGRWRATFIIILTIPVSLIASFAYLLASGNTLNVISLSSLSIAIGMVVDDAIVVLENVTTHIERGSPPKQAAIYGTNEVGISVIASTLTILAVFLPLTMVSGMAGIMFKQLGWMVSIVVTVSTVAALTLTPMLCSRLLKLNPKRGKIFMFFYSPIEKGLDNLDNIYVRMLTWTIRHKTVTVIGAILIFISSLGLMKFVGTEFFPATDNGQIVATVELPVSSRVELTQETAKKLTDTFRKQYPEIEVVSYTVGTAEDDNVFAAMSSNGNNIINYTIRLSKATQRKRSATLIADLMRNDIEVLPEVDKFQVSAGAKRGQSSTSGGSFVDIEVLGYDLATTDRISKEIAEKVKTIKGARDITISREDYKPEFQIDFDREKLALNGLNLGTASQYVRNRINGLTASKFREDGDEYDIIVRYDKNFRQSVEDLENIVIYNPQGKGIKVKDVGKVVERFSPPAIEHLDKERIVKVSVAVVDVPLNVIVTDINKAIATIDVPAEIGISIGGSYEDQQESFGDIILLMVLAIILVYIVMASQFESFTSPLIIMLSLPFAFTGVFLALFLSGTNLSIIALIGAVMLVGIVVKNGIVLIDYINLNRERGMSISQSVILGGKSRLRPVLMTTLTTLLGMFPMALGIGEGSELWRPMGVAIIGGLSVSTLITLILIPAVYAIFGAAGIKKTRKRLAKS